MSLKSVKVANKNIRVIPDLNKKNLLREKLAGIK
jgi:hypothetical protein